MKPETSTHKNTPEKCFGPLPIGKSQIGKIPKKLHTFEKYTVYNRQKNYGFPIINIPSSTSSSSSSSFPASALSSLITSSWVSVASKARNALLIIFSGSALFFCDSMRSFTKSGKCLSQYLATSGPGEKGIMYTHINRKYLSCFKYLWKPPF